MLKLYFWEANYKKGSDIMIVGAETKEEAKKFIDESLSQYNYNGGIEEILVFEEIPSAIAKEKGILSVY